jgi:hypothetical protein
VFWKNKIKKKLTNSHDSIEIFKEIVVYLKIIEKYALVNKEVLAKMNIDFIKDLITVLTREITIIKRWRL